MTKLVSIVLAGGCARRLYPIATALKPKQFFAGTDEEFLFQENVNLISAVAEETIIVSAIRYRNNIILPLNSEQRAQITYIYEPCMRNTLAAVVMGAMVALEKFEDPLLLITPCDLIYQDKSELKVAIKEIIKNHNDNNVTFISDLKSTQQNSFFGPFICRASKLLALCKSSNESNYSQLFKALKHAYIRQNELNINYEDYSSVVDLELRRELFQGKLNICNHILNGEVLDLNDVNDFFNHYQLEDQVVLDLNLKNIDIKSFNQFTHDYFIVKDSGDNLLRRKSAKEEENA